MAASELDAHVEPEPDEKDQEESDAAKQETATISYSTFGLAFVFIVVGVPLWWKTTEVYRVTLPYEQIDELSVKPIELVTRVNVILQDVTSFSNQDALFSKLLHEFHHTQQKSRELRLAYNVSLGYASKEVRKLMTELYNLQDLEHLAERLMRSDDDDECIYDVFVLANSRFSFPRNFYIGHGRVFFYKTSADATGKVRGDGFIENLAADVKSLIMKEDDLRKLVNSLAQDKPQKPEKDMMRKVQSHSAYDITLTLVDSEPINVVSWDIEYAVHAYLRPLLEEISDFADFSVESQVLYYTEFGVKGKAENGKYIVTVKDLSHIITPIEARLGKSPKNPTLNFVVYIPQKQQTPLEIKSEDGKETVAFLSPQWGGVYIYNVNRTADRVMLQMGPVMHTFTAQLRQLLGLNALDPAASATTARGTGFFEASKGSANIHRWEMDSILRKHLLENIIRSSQTLQSLAQLLETISNIVINDEVGHQVYKAVSSLEESHRQIVDGQLLPAFLKSKESTVSSEAAFYHPSILELLYFPEDQKFAIYVPLFLPVSIPVLLSLKTALKWWWRRSHKQEHIKQE